MTKEERFCQDIINANEDINLSVKDIHNIVIAHDDAIRRERIEKTIKWGGNYEGYMWTFVKNDSLSAAIIGTETAPKSSRPISFDGYFYVFTDPTTGKLESYSSYKGAAAAFDKIIATEPAREEL